MKVKPYFYEAPDGHHFPDAMAGATYVYGMNFSLYLQLQSGTFQSATWELEKGLVSHGEFLHPSDDNVPCINLETPYPGSYTVKCTVLYDALGYDQKVTVPLVVKVY